MNQNGLPYRTVLLKTCKPKWRWGACCTAPGQTGVNRPEHHTTYLSTQGQHITGPITTVKKWIHLCLTISGLEPETGSPGALAQHQSSAHPPLQDTKWPPRRVC